MKPFITNALLAAIAVFWLTGCASIVDGRDKRVKLNSYPPGAKVTVTDKSGKVVAMQQTPGEIRLKRNDGFFVPAKYKVSFELDGYYPSQIDVNANLNPWYFGNVVLGGLLGLLIVDPATGAMWTIPNPDVNRNLISKSTVLSPDELKVAEATANPPPKRNPPQPTKGAGPRKF
jgi:hypothetical protein